MEPRSECRIAIKYGKGFDTETLLGRGRRVPEFLWVFGYLVVVLGFRSGFLPSRPYFCVCVSVVVFLSTDTFLYGAQVGVRDRHQVLSSHDNEKRACTKLKRVSTGLRPDKKKERTNAVASR
jgi:hypothetical protein